MPLGFRFSAAYGRHEFTMNAAPHTAHAKRVVVGLGECCAATLKRLMDAVMVAMVAKVPR
jgi:hypothetical protein